MEDKKKEGLVEKLIEDEGEALSPAAGEEDTATGADFALNAEEDQETKPAEPKEIEPDEDGFTSDEDISSVYKSQAELEPEAKSTEEEPKAPAIDLYKEEEKPSPEEGDKAEEGQKGEKKESGAEILENEQDLQGIEAARQTFFKFYKKMNRIKWIVTAVILVIILVCWLVPNFITTGTDAEGNAIALPSEITLGIGIGGIVLGLAILVVYNIFFKKGVERETRNYFLGYYRGSDDFVFGSITKERTGDVDAKLPPETFNEAGLYKDVAKVGSRDCIGFDYKGHHVTFSDAAAQVKGAKALETVFVGKFMCIDNLYKGNELVVYLKGNKRALPPTTLEGRNLLEDTKTMIVYGEHDGKRLLSKDVRAAISKIDTDATLVDFSIVVKPGKTFFLFGYEDNLMILPLEKPFDPYPTMHFKGDVEKVFAIVDTLDKSIERQ